MKVMRGARPISNIEIKEYYDNFIYEPISLIEYADTWVKWIHNTKTKSIVGLENFPHRDYTAGTSQSFDHFVIRNSNKTILAIKGDFQYHRCISKFNQFQYIDYNTIDDFYNAIDKHKSYALIISSPFSDFGSVHYNFEEILNACDELNINVCLDLAYWGISKNVHIDLNNHPCITEMVFSLSKSFYTLENHRVGIRFTREYVDDGISMLNQVAMYNLYSMSLGKHFMDSFGPDWNWEKFGKKYIKVCKKENLKTTDTIIFGLGDKERHEEFNRGISGNYRVCINEHLSDF